MTNLTRKAVFCAASLAALAGTALGQTINWAAAVDGDWNTAANWDLGNVPDTIGESAVLGLGGAYTVTLTSSKTIDGLDITNPDANLHINNGATITVNASTLTNNGVVFFNTDGLSWNDRLVAAVDVSILGTGAFVFDAPTAIGDAQVVANPGFTITHGLDHTIRGNGLLVGTFANSGDIMADDDLGFGLEIRDTINQSPTGRIGALGGIVRLSSATITGGTIDSLGDGIVQADTGVSFISGVTNNGHMGIRDNTTHLALTGNLTNNGLLTIHTGLASWDSVLRFDADATIDGTGTIEMTPSTAAADARIEAAAGFTGTIGSGQFVTGGGRLHGTLINDGTIAGTDAVYPLEIHDAMTNNGIVRADGDGIVALESGELHGGTVETTGNGLVYASTGTSLLSGVTNNGHMGIRDNITTLALTGNLTNNGLFTIHTGLASWDSVLRFDADATIDGTGTIEMTPSTAAADARIEAATGFTGTIGSGQLVTGGGRLHGTLINNGTIAGTDAVYPLEIHDMLTNTGIVRADGDGIVALESGELHGGTVETTGNGLVYASSGTTTVSGVTNNGHMGIRDNISFMALTGNLTNNGLFTIHTGLASWDSILRFDANAIIGGTGTIEMTPSTATADARIEAAATFTGTLGAAQTVTGGGQIKGTIVNNGTIAATDAVYPLEIHDALTNNGIVRADGDGIVALESGELHGGTIETTGNGLVYASSGTTTVSGVTNSGHMGIRDNIAIMALTGGLTNNGLLTIHTGLASWDSVVRFDADAAINGTGDIEMFAPTSIADARIEAAAGFTGTIGAGQSLSGEGRFIGDLNILGPIAPGQSAGLMQFNSGTFSFAPTTALDIELGGTDAADFDRITLNSTGVLNLAGTVDFTFINSFNPSFGDEWVFIDGGTINGEFDTALVPPAPGGFIHKLFYESDRVYLVMTCPADLTGDTVVDAGDLGEFITRYLASQPPNAADPLIDFTGDGIIDAGDLGLFISLYLGVCGP